MPNTHLLSANSIRQANKQYNKKKGEKEKQKPEKNPKSGDFESVKYINRMFL